MSSGAAKKTCSTRSGDSCLGSCFNAAGSITSSPSAHKRPETKHFAVVGTVSLLVLPRRSANAASTSEPAPMPAAESTAETSIDAARRRLGVAAQGRPPNLHELLRKGQLNRHTMYRPATTTRNTGQTGAVTAVAPLGGLTHRRGLFRAVSQFMFFRRGGKEICRRSASGAAMKHIGRFHCFIKLYIYINLTHDTLAATRSSLHH